MILGLIVTVMHTVALIPPLHSPCVSPVGCAIVSSRAGGSWFGYAVTSVGDIDDDGTLDLAVGAPKCEVSIAADRVEFGAVVILSGKNLSEIRRTEGHGLLGSAVVAIPDWTGDGIEEVLCGSFHSGLWVVDPMTAKVLRQVEAKGSPGLSECFLSRIQDTDGDDKDDVLVVWPCNMIDGGYASLVEIRNGRTLEPSFVYAFGRDLIIRSPAVMVWNGGRIDEAEIATVVERRDNSAGLSVAMVPLKTSQVRIKAITALNLDSRAGIAATPDQDGDGKPDLAIGGVAWMYGPASSGCVRLLSSAKLDVLARITSHQASPRFGSSLWMGGDYDMDGAPDLLIGQSEDLLIDRTAGACFVYSLAKKEMVRTHLGETSQLFGFSVIGVEDMTADGVSDYLVGCTDGNPGGSAGGALILFSGKDGKAIASASVE